MVGRFHARSPPVTLSSACFSRKRVKNGLVGILLVRCDHTQWHETAPAILIHSITLFSRGPLGCGLCCEWQSCAPLCRIVGLIHSRGPSPLCAACGARGSGSANHYHSTARTDLANRVHAGEQYLPVIGGSIDTYGKPAADTHDRNCSTIMLATTKWRPALESRWNTHVCSCLLTDKCHDEPRSSPPRTKGVTRIARINRGLSDSKGQPCDAMNRYCATMAHDERR
jgi:hypothetical protein